VLSSGVVGTPSKQQLAYGLPWPSPAKVEELPLRGIAYSFHSWRNAATRSTILVTVY
jgi:hypothetical protein